MHVKKSRIPMTRLLSLLLCTAMFGSIFAPAVMAEDGEPIVVEEAEARYYGEAELLPAPEPEPIPEPIPEPEEPAQDPYEAELLFAELLALNNANDLFNALQALNEEQRALLGEQRLYALEQRLYALRLAENSAMFPAPPEETEEEESEDGQNEEEIEEEAEPLFYMELTAHTGEEDPDDRIVVTVRGEFPEGAYVTVSEIPDEETGLEEIVAEDEEYMALDISLRRVDGTEMEPNATVMVDISLGKNRIPETLPVAEEITLVHMEETEEEITAVEMAGLQMNVSEENVDASFVTASFSTFIIKWKGNYYNSDFKVTVHYVNKNGEELKDSVVDHENVDYSSDDYYYYSNSKTYKFADFAESIADLQYVGAKVGSSFSSAKAATDLTFSKPARSYTRTVTYKNNGTTLSVSGTPDVWLVYESISVTPEVEVTSMLTHDKYVTEKEDGSYDLTLTVSGAVGSETTPALLDLVLVMDLSYSMRYNISNDSGKNNERLNAAKNAAKSLITTISGKSEINTRYSIVSFGSSSSLVTDWTASASTASTAINNLSISGIQYTNYQAAILKANAQLAAGKTRKGAQTVVVFLTDGEPTCSNSLDYGSSSKHISQCNAAAVAEIANMNVSRFYAIGFGPDFSTSSSSSGKTNLQALCNNVNAQLAAVYTATSQTELNNAFNDIAASTVQMLCTNVTVKDTLSTNAEIVSTSSGEPKSVTFSAKDAKGNEKAKLVSGTKYRYTLAAGDENKSGGTATVTYNNGKLDLAFSDGYKLEAGWVYSYTANIQPSDAAYTYYQENGTYPNQDYPTTSTRNSKGFYSNTEEPPAVVNYTFQGQNLTEEYPKPVIQLRTADVTITKTVTAEDEEALDEIIGALMGDEENNIKPLTFTLTLPDGSTKTIPFAKLAQNYEGMDEDIGYYIEASVSGITKTTGSASQTFTMVLPRMKLGKYTVAESNYAVDEYNRADGATGGNGTTGWTGWTSTGSPVPTTIALTNSYTHNVGELKITKTVTAENSARLGAVLDALSTGGFTLSYVNDNDSTITDSYAVKRSDWTVSGSTATYTWEVGEVLIGSYTASESNAAADGFTLTTSGSVKGGVTKKQTTELELANDYKIKFGTIQVTKNLTQKSETPQKDMNYIFEVAGTTVAGESVVYYIPVLVPAGSKTASNSIDYAIYGNYTCTELTPAVGSLSGSISCNSNTGTLSDSNNPLTFTATNTFNNHVDFDTAVANNRFSYESSSWSWSRVLG